MGLGVQGLRGLIQSISQTIAQLVGQDIVAKSIRLTGGGAGGSGTTAIKVETADVVMPSTSTAQFSQAGTGMAGLASFYSETGMFDTNAVSGQIGVRLRNAGARLKLSSGGTVDYFTSDGSNTITAAGNLQSSGDTVVGTGGSGDLTCKRDAYTTMGASSTTAKMPCIPNVNSTVAGNTADTNEDNLMTYSLPGNAMSANNKGVRITAWGDGVSTADVTTVKVYFGATAVVTKVLTASQANTWKAVVEVLRTGATTQIATGILHNGGTAQSFVHSNASPAETLSGAVTIKCTGQRATTSSANSVRQLGMIVEFIN